eukprot:81982-Prymnesium_polylepis.1
MPSQAVCLYKRKPLLPVKAVKAVKAAVPRTPRLGPQAGPSKQAFQARGQGRTRPHEPRVPHLIYGSSRLIARSASAHPRLLPHAHIHSVKIVKAVKTY